MNSLLNELVPFSPTHKKTALVLPSDKFAVKKTINRHALPGEYITPYDVAANLPVLFRVIESFFEERYVNEPKKIKLHKGTNYVNAVICSDETYNYLMECLKRNELSRRGKTYYSPDATVQFIRLQYYEYVVVSKWEGDIDYAIKNYKRQVIYTCE